MTTWLLVLWWIMFLFTLWVTLYHQHRTEHWYKIPTTTLTWWSLATLIPVYNLWHAYRLEVKVVRAVSQALKQARDRDYSQYRGVDDV